MIASNKITAGIPALSPSRRSRRFIQERTRCLDKANLRDEIFRENQTTAADGSIPTTSIECQLGRPLGAHEITNKLKKMNPNLYFEPSKKEPRLLGIYHLRGDKKVFVCGMERKLSPEFSVRHSKVEHVPDPDVSGHWQKVQTFVDETRGWRTVLARLLHAKLITEPQINRYFGSFMTRDSKNWQSLTT